VTATSLRSLSVPTIAPNAQRKQTFFSPSSEKDRLSLKNKERLDRMMNSMMALNLNAFMPHVLQNRKPNGNYYYPEKDKDLLFRVKSIEKLNLCFCPYGITICKLRYHEALRWIDNEFELLVPPQMHPLIVNSITYQYKRGPTKRMHSLFS